MVSNQYGEWDETLSEYLSRLASDCPSLPDLEGDPNHQMAVDHIDGLMGSMISARESIQAVDYSDIEAAINAANPRFLREQFDYQYTQRVLAEVPRFVERTLRLSSLVGTGRAASPRLQVYVREATRCYVFGLWTAAVALCRTAVEYAVRERLRDHLGQGSQALGTMIEGARRFKVLDRLQADLAMRVKVNGDRAVHGDSISDAIAWDTLVATRGLLEQLHA